MAQSPTPPNGPNEVQWRAIQALVDDDCPMSMLAEFNRGEISLARLADRIEAYAVAAFEIGRATK